MIAPAVQLLICCFAAPLIVLAGLSVLQQSETGAVVAWTSQNFRSALTEWLYVGLLLRSLVVAACVAVLAVVFGYPVAWLIAHAPERSQMLLLTLLILPWSASYIVRVLACYSIFGSSGLINLALGMADGPVGLFGFGLPAVVLTELNLYLPLAVIPVYMALEQLDWSTVNAARSLGAGWMTIFRRVVLPFSLPGGLPRSSSCLCPLPARSSCRIWSAAFRPTRTPRHL